jgi:hypothetical protein
MNRRDFIKLVAGVPFLDALALEVNTSPDLYNPAGKFLIESDQYVIKVSDGEGLEAQSPARSIYVDKNGHLKFSTTFDVNEANFEWREMALFINGRCVKRDTRYQGKKTPGQSWTISFDIDEGELCF